MNHAHKILKIASCNTNLQKKLSDELGISQVLAQVLINRGMKESPAAHEFLNCGTGQLLDPRLFKDMPCAVELVNKAASGGKKVMVFGDYDADGVTALVLLKETLEKKGLRVLHYLPHRVHEGYGLNRNAVRLAIEEGVGLMITADCGISSHDEIKELRGRDIDVIVTDHHEPSSKELPAAQALINPKAEGSGYPFRDLAGVGVAYKFCQALTGTKMLQDLDVVCLGTIADSVPLVGENRVIAKEGLARLPSTKREGLRALMESARISNRPFNPEFVSFILAPRINACGRVDSAEVSLKLLLCSNKEEARQLAGVLDSHNRLRQKIESRILEEAGELIEKDFDRRTQKVIVLAKEDWHRGVLGIVASRIADKYYRPAVIISMDGGLCKGSGRSVKNFHLFDALMECREHLSGFGGHAHAVGLVVHRDNIEDFRRSLLRYAADKLLLQDLIPSLEIDLELNFADINDRLLGELDLLRPFGEGNPEPLFYTKGLKLKGQPQCLRRDTLKFRATDGERTFQAIGFGMGQFSPSIEAADSFDMVYSARTDTWQGVSSVILEAKDIFFR